MSTSEPGAGPEPGFEPTDEGERSWSWQFADEAGVALERSAPEFASQRAAEDWLSDNFADLADQDVTAVTLLDGERAVYGPMPLAPG